MLEFGRILNALSLNLGLFSTEFKTFTAFVPVSLHQQDDIYISRSNIECFN